MYKSLEEICEMTTKEGKPFWKIVQEDDCKEQGISEGEAFEQMRGMYQAMREADDNYDGKLKSASGLVGTDGEKMHAAREAGTLQITDILLKPEKCHQFLNASSKQEFIDMINQNYVEEGEL